MNVSTIPVRRIVTSVLLVACLALVLVSAGLVTGRWQAAPVLTGSMSPGIEPGALIIAESGSVADLRVDDVIVFHAPTAGRPVTVHRVVAMETSDDGVMVTTKGDANEDIDRWGPLELTDQRIWTVTRVIPGLGRAILAVRSPATQFIALVLLAVAIGWLYSEDRDRRRPRQFATKPVDTSPPVEQEAPGSVMVTEAPPVSAPLVEAAIPAQRATVALVPSRARIDLDTSGRPVGLWISLDTLEVSVDGPDRVLVHAGAGPADVPKDPATARPRSWMQRIGTTTLAVVLLGLAFGASANAAFRAGAADDLTVSTSSLAPPTSLTAAVAALLDACTVELDWTPTVSLDATGYDVLRQPIEAAPVIDLEPSGDYVPTGPYEVVGTVPGRESAATTDALPEGTVQLNSGFRYALRSTRGAWTSGLSQSVDVTALGACLSVKPPKEPKPPKDPVVDPVAPEPTATESTVSPVDPIIAPLTDALLA